MRTLCFALILASAAAHKSTLRMNPEGMTLRKWIQSQKCLNMASLPLMNTQFAQLGMIDALESAGLMDKVTGLSGVSSGAFVTAIAASKNRTEASKNFRQYWPGWGKLGKKDPDFSQNYKEQVLDKVVPATFEELKIPLATVSVHYLSEKAAKEVDYKQAEPVITVDGELPEAIIVSSSAMMGPGCPNCDSGFKAKNFRGMWPVADGFLLDEYGTFGLNALAPCPNLFHIMPQNGPQQLLPTLNTNLDTQPTNVVSLGLDVPSSAIMSMMWDQIRETKMFKFMHAANPMIDIPVKALGANEDENWEKIQYDTAYEHMKENLDKPMMVGEEKNHFFVDLNLVEHWGTFRGPLEKKFDDKNDKAHGEYWVKTIPRRNELIGERNTKIKAKKLSYLPGGNGKGAPKIGAPKKL